ncbi:MAG: hypothetical protein K9M75_05635 [Phycisphaerae bacterium]|nr:hypothetical protein [Phycisphaerae bacterium]
MFNLKLKQAKAAFSDGRLDEAYDLVFAGVLLGQRQGQKLAKKLAAALIARGNAHLEASRVDSALADCNKAEKLAGNLTDAAKLRADICKSIEDNRFAQAKHQAVLEDARANIQNGMVSVGRAILEKAPESGQAAILTQQASVIGTKTAAVISKANAAIERNDLDHAVRILADAKLNTSANTSAAETITLAASRLAEIITEKLNTGRLDHAADYLCKLTMLSPDSSQTKDFTYALAQCQIAADSLNCRNLPRALETLRRLRTILPNAKWLEAAIKDAQKAAEAIDDLMVGPLSMLWSQDQPRGIVSDGLPAAALDVQKENSLVYENSNEKMPNNFLLQIDGVGSYMVISETPATIGPISSSHRPLVGLMAQPGLPVATIDRVEGDYFIRSKEPLDVNDSSVTDKLLEDGDKISLSMRCRMKFNVPNAASSTAVISLASARLPNADTRNIILMDREILIGAGIKNHIRATGMNDQIVLFKQNGKLLCRTDQNIEVDEKRYDSRIGLTMNKPITIGKMSLVLKEAISN